MFAPSVRRALLAVHVAVSVGWMGAAAAYVVLGATAVAAADGRVVRGAYVMMWPVAAYALVPLAIATLVTGVAQSLGTPWGLFKHYWVVISFLVTGFATVVLVLHLPAVARLADQALDPSYSMAGRGGDLFHSIGGLVVLAVPLVLNVFKPRGLTAYGWRQQRHRTDP
jgi:hypothetical protein